MKTKKPRTYAKDRATLPKRFTPRILAEADGRRWIVRRQRKRVAELISLATKKNGVTEKLAQRAAFIELKLETAEVNELAGNESTSAGSVVQLTNALRSLYADMGIATDDAEKKPDLDEYLASKKAK